MRAVIMQPTYLPWMGYFDLIDQSDVFVFLDTVQFEKQSWQQRNRIKTAQGPTWLTVPVFQTLGQKIQDVAIRESTNFRHKHWMSIQSNYGRAPMWRELSDRLKHPYDRPWERLAELNIHFIALFADLLGLETRFVRASEIPEPLGRKAEMLVEMCRHLGATSYLSPVGARDYLNDDAQFGAAGIALEFQAYAHPSYPQLFGEFLPHMSIVDLLLNVGPQKAREVIRSGRGQALRVGDLPATGGAGDLTSA